MCGCCMEKPSSPVSGILKRELVTLTDFSVPSRILTARRIFFFPLGSESETEVEKVGKVMTTKNCKVHDLSFFLQSSHSSLETSIF